MKGLVDKLQHAWLPIADAWHRSTPSEWLVGIVVGVALLILGWIFSPAVRSVLSRLWSYRYVSWKHYDEVKTQLQKKIDEVEHNNVLLGRRIADYEEEVSDLKKQIAEYEDRSGDATEYRDQLFNLSRPDLDGDVHAVLTDLRHIAEDTEALLKANRFLPNDRALARSVMEIARTAVVKGNDIVKYTIVTRLGGTQSEMEEMKRSALKQLKKTIQELYHQRNLQVPAYRRADGTIVVNVPMFKAGKDMNLTGNVIKDSTGGPIGEAGGNLTSTVERIER